MYSKITMQKWRTNHSKIIKIKVKYKYSLLIRINSKNKQIIHMLDFIINKLEKLISFLFFFIRRFVKICIIRSTRHYNVFNKGQNMRWKNNNRVEINICTILVGSSGGIYVKWWTKSWTNKEYYQRNKRRN